jgi:hypothetical protein
VQSDSVWYDVAGLSRLNDMFIEALTYIIRKELGVSETNSSMPEHCLVVVCLPKIFIQEECCFEACMCLSGNTCLVNRLNDESWLDRVDPAGLFACVSVVGVCCGVCKFSLGWFWKL